MAQRRERPWWWRTEVLARMVVALSATVAATYLARLLMYTFPDVALARHAGPGPRI